jgi:hypothetical protein
MLGEAPNIAARVQGLADPGTVVMSANAQRQTAGLFVAEGRTARSSSKPCRCRPRLTASCARAAGGARGARSLTPLSSGARRSSNSCVGAGVGPQSRGPACTHCRRTRHREIAPGLGVSRNAWRDARHLSRTVVVAGWRTRSRRSLRPRQSRQSC